MSANTRGRIVLAIVTVLIPLAFLTGLAVGKSQPTVSYVQMGQLTIKYEDGCAVRSIDPDGYMAIAPRGACLTGTELTTLPHSR